MGYQIYARKRSKKERNIGLFLAILGSASFYIGTQFGNPYYGLLPAVIFWFLSAPHFKYSNIWHLGAVGEEKVAQVLEGLGNSYHIINDLYCPSQRGNFDHIVLGQNGVFLIETKNHKGIIKCNGDDWKQEKVGRLGSSYEGLLRNPSLQVKANAALISNFIKQHLKKNVWVNPIIVFTNEEAELHINKPTIPIFRPEELCEFIKNYKSNRRFTNQELLEMKKLENWV